MRKYDNAASKQAKRQRETSYVRRHHGVIHYGGRWLTPGQALRLLERLAAERRNRCSFGDEA